MQILVLKGKCKSVYGTIFNIFTHLVLSKNIIGDII